MHLDTISLNAITSWRKIGNSSVEVNSGQEKMNHGIELLWSLSDGAIDRCEMPNSPQTPNLYSCMATLRYFID